MTIQEFFSKYSGKFLDSDGAYGNQCVDVVRQYLQDVLNDKPVAGNAIDLWVNFPPTYQRIKNTPFNFPQLGDIVIWGQGLGLYGHVAICQSASIWNLTCFGQNWPIGSNCHFQKSGYKNIVGWLRFNKVVL